MLEGQIPADFDGDGFLSLTEVQRATSSFMDSRAYGHSAQRQPAVADDEYGLGSRPVLSMRNAAAKPKNADTHHFHLYHEDLPKALNTALAAVPNVVFDGKPAQADIILKLAENNKLAFVAANGALIAKVPQSDIKQIIAQVRQLAWAWRVRASAQLYARGALAAEIDPTGSGGRFNPGEKIRFVARPERAAHLLLMNIDSLGKVSVLFPRADGDIRPLGQGQAVFLPRNDASQRIEVKEPFGMDIQFIFAFDQPPKGLADLIGLTDADPDPPKLRALMPALNQSAGKFTFTSTKLRVMEPY